MIQSFPVNVVPSEYPKTKQDTYDTIWNKYHWIFILYNLGKQYLNDAESRKIFYFPLDVFLLETIFSLDATYSVPLESRSCSFFFIFVFLNTHIHPLLKNPLLLPTFSWNLRSFLHSSDRTKSSSVYWTFHLPEVVLHPLIKERSSFFILRYLPLFHEYQPVLFRFPWNHLQSSRARSSSNPTKYPSSIVR